jgi:hypothetical protein
VPFETLAAEAGSEEPAALAGALREHVDRIKARTSAP